MQAMLLSTSYNSVATVLSNLHHAFTEVATKTYHYIRSLPPKKRPADQLVISKSMMSHRTAYRILLQRPHALQ